jgi:TonB family protein
MPDAPPGNLPVGRIQTRQFGELDHTELVRLLDTLDDERSKARFRESIYISLFFWIAVVAFIIFAPRYLPHGPRFATPIHVEKERTLTDLTVPPDVQRALDHAPRFKTAPKPQSQPQMPAIQPPATVQPQPAPQAAAPQTPPPVVQQSPLPTPRSAPQPNVAALPSAPAASQTKPNFGNPNTSARDLVRQAGQGGRDSGADLPATPNRRGDLASGAEILSDTQGVDFTAWGRRFKQDVTRNWTPLLPESFFPPLNKTGKVVIRLMLSEDGNIADMKLEGPSGDVSLDKAAWGAITSEGQFAHMPAGYHGPLEMRITFVYGKFQE